MTQQEVKEAIGLQIGSEGVGACEKLLESAGVIERLEPSENMALVRLASDVPTLVELLPAQAKAKRRVMRAVEQLVGSRRHEWCYFQPRELLRAMPELDSTDLARHLRELTALSAFEYVPPFRGRAIHVRQRNVAFEDIEIDFETLERQKAAEYERLEQVLRFARDHRCRQQRILEYFGQLDAAPCGHCDNCCPESSGSRWGAPREISGQVLDAVRIVLSGVARVAQRRVGCGKQLLAKMLCGSSDKAVERNRLNKLSTFGLLSHLTQTDVLQLTDALLLCGLLEQSEIEPFRPILQLTDRGTEVMSGRAGESLNLPLPDELWRKLDPTAARPPAQGTADDGSAAQAADVQPPPDASLVARLRQWRDATRKALNVPAYVVLTNAVMDELARVRPRSVDELSAVKGIGPKKAGQYGDELLAIVADRTSNEPREVQLSSAAEPQDHPPATSTSTTPAPAPPAQPSHYWTWRLLSTGFSPDECRRNPHPGERGRARSRAAGGGPGVGGRRPLVFVERADHRDSRRRRGCRARANSPPVGQTAARHAVRARAIGREIARVDPAWLRGRRMNEDRRAVFRRRFAPGGASGRGRKSRPTGIQFLAKRRATAPLLKHTEETGVDR